MVEKATVDEWVARIQKTRSGNDLLKLLEQFRAFDWTDQERQKISHTYMRMLDGILKGSVSEALKKAEAATGAPANDGPVWYEKM